MIKLFSLKEQKAAEEAAGTTQTKKVSAAQLRITKGNFTNFKFFYCISWYYMILPYWIEKKTNPKFRPYYFIYRLWSFFGLEFFVNFVRYKRIRPAKLLQNGF